MARGVRYVESSFIDAAVATVGITREELNYLATRLVHAEKTFPCQTASARPRTGSSAKMAPIRNGEGKPET
jgi:hypothetical protein